MDTLPSLLGCDTLLFLDLTIADGWYDFDFKQLCPDEERYYFIPDYINDAAFPLYFSIDDGETFEPYDTYRIYVDEIPQVVLYRDGVGCLWKDTLVPAAYNLQPVYEEDDLIISQGEELPIEMVANFSLDNVSAFLINWTPEEGLSCTDCLNPIVSPEQTTQYVVKFSAWGGAGCRLSETIKVVVVQDTEIYFPNIFSPNEDGINDRFTIYANYPSEVVQTNYLRIFDYWGEMVFELKDFQPNDESLGWDGSFLGELMNPGTYLLFSETEFKDGTVVKQNGLVTLVR